MLAFIVDFDDALFICTESEIESIEALGIDLRLNETNNYEDKLHWFYQPAYFFRLNDEEDRNLLKLTHKYQNITLEDIYGHGGLLIKGKN